ncbi:hypothetical protein M23134_04233 [Microscilla marina ATCC 23134]|uniref:Uncharacterized protein n=1 Tax=Microscilla marina ATCC 23134 TaxID=313606 RepID=A1ZE92_MICM2|nr:hypothetical protein M23134_04233 [Microscilla marina ATCC 23134]
MDIFFQEVWGYKISQMAQVILVVLLKGRFVCLSNKKPLQYRSGFPMKHYEKN